MASFNGKTPVNFDKIYTPLEVIQKCNRFLVDILINEGAEIDQIIDPAAGPNIWLNDLLTYFDAPVKTYSLDIAPDNDQVKKFDWLKLKDKELKYSEHRLIVTNPPYGRSNNGTVSFINIGLKHAKWVAMLVPTGTWTSIRVKNFNKRWKLDIGPINQIFKGCGIFNEKTNSCNISFIVYESANDPKKELELPFGNILDDKEDDVEILELHGNKSHPPHYEDVNDKLDGTEVFVCSLGLEGSIFSITDDPERYANYLAIRFKSKELKDQYLSIDPAILREEFKKELGNGHLTPYRWYEIVSRFMDLKKPEFHNVEFISYKNMENDTHMQYKDISSKLNNDDIYCCGLGIGSLFYPCEPNKYNHMLALRFKNKELKEQYLHLEHKALNEEFIKEYGKQAQCTPYRWYEIVSRFMDLKKNAIK